MSEERTNKYAEHYSELLVKCWPKGKWNHTPWLNELESAKTIEQHLVLIHPDFWGLKLGLTRVERNKHHPLGTGGKRDFDSIKRAGVCVTKGCRFQYVIPVFESGHIWPDSLGGPAILRNGHCQCYTCNRMQSHSILNVPWYEWEKEPPRWLKYMIDIMKNKY